MANEAEAGKVSYPYMTAGQWFGVRTKLRQSLPGVVDVDWIMAALGTSEKGARNVMPQLKAVGVLTADGKPNMSVVHDLRDDGAYAEACARIVENVYPDGLRSAWPDPDEDPTKVANWFMRNAATGQATAMTQAKLYLTLLKAELPPPDAVAKKASAKKAVPPTPAKKSAAKTVGKGKEDATADTNENGNQQHRPPPPPPAGYLGPNLHIDMQIHISADASDTQIDTIFKSMARHLYARE